MEGRAYVWNRYRGQAWWCEGSVMRVGEEHRMRHVGPSLIFEFGHGSCFDFLSLVGSREVKNSVGSVDRLAFSEPCQNQIVRAVREIPSMDVCLF